MPPMKVNYRALTAKQQNKSKIKRYIKKAIKGAMKAGAVVSPTIGVADAIMSAAVGTQTEKRTRSGGRITGYLGGKVRKGKRNNYRKRTKKGKLTEYGIARTGITLNYESRKEVSAKEALAIGHTSMPGKVCLINVFRALLKRLMMDMKIIIKDYGSNMVSLGFVVGDIIRINRYPTGVATTVIGDTFTVANTWTFDTMAASMAAFYDDVEQLNDDRFDSIEFLPQSTSRFPGTNLNLVSAKVSVHTKSSLKIQNISTEVAADNEADDVNAIVLSGKLYGCKGNNFVRKSNTKLLEGLFTQFNEEAIFGAYDIQNASVIGGTSVGFYSGEGTNNDIDTTFYKPAEPPKFYEIQNCKTTAKLSVAPGAIKTSILTQSYTLSLQYYLMLLLGKRNTKNDVLVYNADQGKTNVMYLEKVIGRSQTETNDIKLWTELDFKQSVVINTSVSRYTLPIQYQSNF